MQLKKILCITSIAAITIVGGVMFFNGKIFNKVDVVTQESNINKSDNEVNKNSEIATHIFSYSPNGIVSLYDIDSSKQLDTFDLKSIQIVKKEINQKVINDQLNEDISKKEVKATKKNVKKVIKHISKNDSYKGFVKVPIVIQKNDVAWKIQKALTPNRNTVEMMKLVREVNDQKMHPIYKGEVRLFLKEFEDVENTEEVLLDEEEQTINDSIDNETNLITKPITKVDANEKMVELSKDTSFIYYKSCELNTLYAYNDESKTFYSVSFKDDKLEVNNILTDFEINGVNNFQIVNNVIYYLMENNKDIKTITLSNLSYSTITLKGKVSSWTVKDNIIYYTYDNMIGKIDTNTNEQLNALLGDMSEEIFFSNDNLYVLNVFGSGNNDSILIQLSSKNLTVESIVRLGSDTNVILSSSVSNKVYIAQTDKTIQLSKVITEEPKILPIDLETMEKEKAIKDVSINSTSIENNGYFYVLENKKLSIYSTVGNTVKMIDVDGIDFMTFKVN